MVKLLLSFLLIVNIFFRRTMGTSHSKHSHYRGKYDPKIQGMMADRSRKAYSATYSIPPSFGSESNKNEVQTPKKGKYWSRIEPNTEYYSLIKGSDNSPSQKRSSKLSRINNPQKPSRVQSERKFATRYNSSKHSSQLNKQDYDDLKPMHELQPEQQADQIMIRIKPPKVKKQKKATPSAVNSRPANSQIYDTNQIHLGDKVGKINDCLPKNGNKSQQRYNAKSKQYQKLGGTNSLANNRPINTPNKNANKIAQSIPEKRETSKPKSLKKSGKVTNNQSSQLSSRYMSIGPYANQHGSVLF